MKEFLWFWGTNHWFQMVHHGAELFPVFVAGSLCYDRLANIGGLYYCALLGHAALVWTHAELWSLRLQTVAIYIMVACIHGIVTKWKLRVTPESVDHSILWIGATLFSHLSWLFWNRIGYSEHHWVEPFFLTLGPTLVYLSEWRFLLAVSVAFIPWWTSGIGLNLDVITYIYGYMFVVLRCSYRLYRFYMSGWEDEKNEKLSSSLIL